MARIYQFGDYQVNVERRALLRGTAALLIQPRTFDILLMLLEHRHRVVEKDELLARVWPDQFVEESNLTQQVFVLRRLLGGGQYVATVPRRGYQFVAPVDEIVLPSPRAVPPSESRGLRVNVTLEPPVVRGPTPALALSRDGSLLVYVGEHDGSTALCVRRLDTYDTRMLPGTRGAAAPFFSPDGRWIGYTAGGRLQRIARDGGTALSICDVEGAGRGASWGRENLIVFAPVPAGPLFIVAATGGTPRPLTRLAYLDGERSHRFPAFTPDGRHVIFTISRAGDSSFDQARLAITAPDPGAHRVILEGGSCGVVTGGRLHYQRAGILFASDFDAMHGTCDPGEPQEPIAVHEAGAAHVAAADSGIVLYAPPLPPLAPARLVWRDSDGNETALEGLSGVPEEPRISPDGSRVVFGLRAETSDLWLYDLERRTLSRLTELGDNFAAIWTRDGEAIVFSSNRGGPSNLYRLSVGAPDPALPLVESLSEQVPGAWTADGKTLLFTQYDAETGADLCRWKAGEGTLALLRSRFNEYVPALSHDGRWLAYTTDASGTPEVNIIRYPELVDRRQVSRGGGSEPVWAPRRSRLYFRTAGSLCAVEVADTGAIAEPQDIARDRYLRGSITGLPNYDVHPDGRLLLVAPPEVRATRTHLNAVIPCGPRT